MAMDFGDLVIGVGEERVPLVARRWLVRLGRSHVIAERRNAAPLLADDEAVPTDVLRRARGLPSQWCSSPARSSIKRASSLRSAVRA
jgi:hypothetical protein